MKLEQNRSPKLLNDHKNNIFWQHFALQDNILTTLQDKIVLQSFDNILRTIVLSKTTRACSPKLRKIARKTVHHYFMILMITKTS